MMFSGSGKTSALLYGLPGTGKTRLIKYFSLKYDLPIYSIYLNPEYNNLDILFMFSDIPKKCIVLFEDFDNYFDKRECIMKNNEVKFTYDVILSVLDGVYNEYNQVAFFMTCNDIEKVDKAIKERPSRMKYVREITGPNFAKRLDILDGDVELADAFQELYVPPQLLLTYNIYVVFWVNTLVVAVTTPAAVVPLAVKPVAPEPPTPEVLTSHSYPFVGNEGDAVQDKLAEVGDV